MAVLLGIVGLGLVIYWLNSEVGGKTPAQTTSASLLPIFDSAKLDFDAVSGRVLPFQIIAAIRNFGFKDMVDAQISASVEGGKPADWMATSVYIAEHATVNGATFSEVELYVPNPWGDNPPTRSKMLCKVYYAPDPPRSPWPNKVWSIFTADQTPTLADIEYDKLGNDLLSNKIDDPGNRMDVADAQARRIVVRKYKLSPKWQPTEGLGLTGVEYDRGHVRISATDNIDRSMTALAACLDSENGLGIFKGCMADRTAAEN